MRQGRLAEAEAALRHALALRPDFALPHSNILFCLNYRPDVSAEEIFAEYRRWDRQHALPLLPAHPSFELDRSPERRLRIGYVSPDFRQHAVALFAEPLLAAHDRSAVELHCYAEVPSPDAVTERFRDLADHWHSTVGLSDAELAEQIRRDRIDVLVDLAGPHRRQSAAHLRAQAGTDTGGVAARSRLHLRAFRDGRIPRRCRVGAAGFGWIVQRAPGPTVANSARLRAAGGDAGRGTAARAAPTAASPSAISAARYG